MPIEIPVGFRSETIHTHVGIQQREIKRNRKVNLLSILNLKSIKFTVNIILLI